MSAQKTYTIDEFIQKLLEENEGLTEIDVMKLPEDSRHSRYLLKPAFVLTGCGTSVQENCKRLQSIGGCKIVTSDTSFSN